MTSGIHTYRDINRKTAEVAVTMYHGVRQLFPSAPPQQADLYLRLMRLAHQHMSDILSGDDEGSGPACALTPRDIRPPHYPADLPNNKDRQFLHHHRWRHPTAADIRRKRVKDDEHRVGASNRWDDDDLVSEQSINSYPEFDLDEHGKRETSALPPPVDRVIGPPPEPTRPRPRFH